MRRLGAILLLVASCGVRAPTPIDVGKLVAQRGAVDARLELEMRILADPRDVAARLAAAQLDQQLKEPSDAIAQYEAVERLGGPLGTRWHDDDKRAFATLLMLRGSARADRDAANAPDDLRRAAKLGAHVEATSLTRASIGAAIVQLRHVDAGERAKGRAAIVRLDPTLPGARPDAKPDDHAAFGVWLWQRGAKRAAYEELALWHDRAQDHNPTFATAYQQALAWWSPDAAVEARIAPGTEAAYVAQPPVAFASDRTSDARADAAARYARARAIEVIDAGLRGADRDVVCAACSQAVIAMPALVKIAHAFRRDPAIAERLATDEIARATESTLARATISALFDALGDPARARTMWLAASEESDESAIVAGYAQAAARAGDGDAALVIATSAAASSGDPAVVWIDTARALLRGNRTLDALTAMRTALDLAGANTLPDALELADSISRMVGRNAQADRFAAQRARLSPPPTGHAAERVELAELAHSPNASVLAAEWVATRNLPADVEVRAALINALDRDDPRRGVLEAELVELASDRDPDRGLSAALALH